MRARILAPVLLATLAFLLAPTPAEAGRQLGESFARQRGAGRKKPASRRHTSGARQLGAGFARQRAAAEAIASDTPYNANAGRNRPRSGSARRDRHGNAEGGDQDLARDGAFRGKQIAVLQLYNNTVNLGGLSGLNGLNGLSLGGLEPPFDFELPRRALEEKGFSVHRWTHVPPVDEMARVLRSSSQLWVISSPMSALGADHTGLIGDFYRSGHGLYLWGDNDPYHHEANLLGRSLLEAEMSGNLQGDQVVGVQRTPGGPGLEPDHLLTTGLEHIYEGITIATIQPGHSLRPLITGSAGNIVAAYHDRDGRRAILDGGFTRLYVKWDTAGTARYLKNAAAWLANTERFGRR